MKDSINSKFNVFFYFSANYFIFKKIKEIVPEYISKNSEFEKLDAKKTLVLPVVETL
jgi:hypothetical protein